MFEAWSAPQVSSSQPPLALPAPAAGGARPAVLALSRSMAAGIVRRAEAEAEATRQAAFEEGLQRGLEQARQRQEASEETQREVLQGALARLEEVVSLADQALHNQLEVAVVGVVMRLCERMLGESLRQDPALLLPSLHEALEELSNCATVTVRLHPDDLERLRQRLPQAGRGRLRLVADPEVGSGGFLAEGDSGAVDGRLSTRLALVREQLGCE